MKRRPDKRRITAAFSMARFYPSREGKKGQPPGDLTVSEPLAETPVQIDFFSYSPDEIREESISSLVAAPRLSPGGRVVWINMNGIHDPSFLERAAQRFSLHPLTVEDIAHTGQRPKFDETEHYLFIVLNMLRYEPVAREIEAEQVSLVLGPDYVLSFQEREGDVFNNVRDRLRKNKGRIRKHGADYLAYCLMDAVVDQYYTILERIGEQVGEVEESILEHPVPKAVQELHRLKRELIFLRKSVWPLRESVGSLYRSESELIRPATEVYLRDLYDHTMHVMDTLETFRDMLSGLLEIYLSSVSSRTNEVMKVLTVIATIFIPLTFVAGVYGMNFEYMPELHWRWGYFGVLGAMALLALALLAFFRRKGWL